MPGATRLRRHSEEENTAYVKINISIELLTVELLTGERLFDKLNGCRFLQTTEGHKPP